MKIKKIKNVKTPQRGTSRSAGYDFFVPEDIKPIIIAPGEDANIPSGIVAKIPKGYALLALSKSGVALNKKLGVGACLVDEDYTGEIHLHVYNWGQNTQQILPGEKLVQFILTPIFYDDIEVVSDIEHTTTERGTGGFGSTGNGIEKPKVEMIKRIPGSVAYVVQIEPVKESRLTGSYQRHLFRDVDNPNKIYILDVCNASKACFKKLNIGDTLMGLTTFAHKNNKVYVDGKKAAQPIGKFESIKHQLVKQKKEPIGIDIFSK